jgi:hypothetical protein
MSWTRLAADERRLVRSPSAFEGEFRNVHATARDPGKMAGATGFEPVAFGFGVRSRCAHGPYA